MLKYFVRFFCDAKCSPFFKARDTMSAIVFSSPAMLSGVRCDDYVAYLRIPRKQSSFEAVWEHPHLSLCDQTTADTLSQKIATCLY